jgi:hypothetical protein
MIEPIQPHQNNFADQDFQQSLNQLKNIFQDNSRSDTSNSAGEASSENIGIAAWEDAVADIEQYLARKNKKR